MRWYCYVNGERRWSFVRLEGTGIWYLRSGSVLRRLGSKLAVETWVMDSLTAEELRRRGRVH